MRRPSADRGEKRVTHRNEMDERDDRTVDIQTPNQRGLSERGEGLGFFLFSTIDVSLRRLASSTGIN
jgi:hypothetical protein